MIKPVVQSLSKGWNRCIAHALGHQVLHRITQLEQQCQAYSQENQTLSVALTQLQTEFQGLMAEVRQMKGFLQADRQSPEQFQHLERQLSRIWQYYQNAKGQFEHLNRQMQQQRATHEELYQKLHKNHTRQRREINDLKQQFDEALFLRQSRSAPLTPEGEVLPEP